MDLDNVLVAKNVLERQLVNAKAEIETGKTVIGKLQNEITLLISKVTNSEQNEIRMRGIMTQNITESNETKQSLLVEIGELKSTLRELSRES